MKKPDLEDGTGWPCHKVKHTPESAMLMDLTQKKLQPTGKKTENTTISGTSMY